ncbi:type VII toxin-antitoxin system HepT family RNase toxin [Catenovulum maritimum]|uniref:DUF86 domain-containing protein n=1 Tax=Catenovulum maritimum TaxID=1513271 RepID=A0A0J8GPK7_9ALTE|nr:DUF86 domain-containing protein [Catenovulum maritimum]KMT64717.1 hypothetical protein XM47_12720 [Catenovulum maritimum]
MTDGLKLYLNEVQSHIASNLTQLEELREDILNQNFRPRDYRATERLLQLSTEACIGLAKHLTKKIQKVAASDAYQAFKILAENNFITLEELAEWRKIIGMRNSLVHDYLNIDLQVLEQILINQKYLTLSDFTNKAIHILK